VSAACLNNDLEFVEEARSALLLDGGEKGEVAAVLLGQALAVADEPVQRLAREALCEREEALDHAVVVAALADDLVEILVPRCLFRGGLFGLARLLVELVEPPTAPEALQEELRHVVVP
jgi:hypothetical protein